MLECDFFDNIETGNNMFFGHIKKREVIIMKKILLILLLLLVMMGCNEKKKPIKDDTPQLPYYEIDSIINNLYKKDYSEVVEYVEKRYVEETSLKGMSNEIKAYRINHYDGSFDAYIEEDDFQNFNERYFRTCIAKTQPYYDYKIRSTNAGLEFRKMDSVCAGYVNLDGLEIPGVVYYFNGKTDKDLELVPKLFGHEFNMLYIFRKGAHEAKYNRDVTDIEFVFSNRHYDVLDNIVPYNTYGKDYSNYIDHDAISSQIMQDTFVDIAKVLMEGYGEGKVRYSIGSEDYFEYRFNKREIINDKYEQYVRINTVLDELDVKDCLLDLFYCADLEERDDSSLEICWKIPEKGTITLTYQYQYPTYNENVFDSEIMDYKDSVRLTITYDDDARYIIGPMGFWNPAYDTVSIDEQQEDLIEIRDASRRIWNERNEKKGY